LRKILLKLKKEYIFKSERLGFRNWTKNDLTEFAQSEIRLYGRNSASGTYAFFKQTALCAGDYKAEVHQQPSSSAIIRSVANQIDSLGYASIGAISNLVKPLALENQSG